MYRHHLGQFSSAALMRPSIPAPVKPAVASLATVKAPSSSKVGVMPLLAAKPVVAKPVASEDRVVAVSKMAIKTADKIRASKMKATGASQQSLDSAETKIRGLVFGLPTKRVSLAQALSLVDEARRDVASAKLPADLSSALGASLQALRSAIAPPVRSTMTVLSKDPVTAAQATVIQGAVDAAVAKLASSGKPVTDLAVKTEASSILKDVASDSVKPEVLKTATLVLTGTARTDESKPAQTLTSTPLPIESVASLVEASESAPPAPEPEKPAESAPETISEPVTTASLVSPAERSKKEGLFGIPWLYVGLGAGVLVVGGVILASRRPAPTPNKRRRGKRSSRRSP